MMLKFKLNADFFRLSAVLDMQTHLWLSRHSIVELALIKNSIKRFETDKVSFDHISHSFYTEF